MSKKKTNATRDTPEFDYDKPRDIVETYFAKACGANVTLPQTDATRLLAYLRKLIEVIEQGGGTEVIANPTLAGTEDALTGLQVGETKYKVDSGTHLYQHFILCNEGGIVLITNDSTAFTLSTLTQYLYTNDIRAPLICGTDNGSSSDNYIYVTAYIYALSNNSLVRSAMAKYIKIDSSNVLTGGEFTTNTAITWIYDRVAQII